MAATARSLTIAYPKILTQKRDDFVVEWTQEQAILYALASGMGSDVEAPGGLEYVYEAALSVLPTIATLALYRAALDDLGIDKAKLLHGGQRVEVFRQLSAPERLIGRSRVVDAVDKEEKGAFITIEIDLVDPADNTLVSRLSTTMVARGDGGFGGPATNSVRPIEMPARSPDAVLPVTIDLRAALFFRLLGDRNPIHIDPDAAMAAGLEKPILHGLCTFSTTCAAIIRWLGYAADEIASHEGWFAAPVRAGEQVKLRLWREDPGPIFWDLWNADGTARVMASGMTNLRRAGNRRLCPLSRRNSHH